MEEGGGLFDTPENVKAALELGQLDSISLIRIIFGLQRKLGNSNLVIQNLLNTNSSKSNQILKDTKRIADLTAENDFLKNQKTQCEIDLTNARKDIQDEATSMQTLRICFKELPVTIALDAYASMTQLYAENINWLRIQPLVYKELKNRLLIKEKRDMCDTPVNTQIYNSNISFDNAQFQGPMYEVKDNDNVILGGIDDGEEI